MTPCPPSTTYVQNRLVSVCLAPIEATPGAEKLPRPLAELKQWLIGLPHYFKQSRAARLLNRLCEAPGQALAWNASGMQTTLWGMNPCSAQEFCQLQQECADLLKKHPIQGLWTVHLTSEGVPGIRLVPGGMMLGYLRELRTTGTGQRPG